MWIPHRKAEHSLCVVHAPLGRATTHSDLVLRAHNLGVKVEVVHNASIMNAIGACGLQLYRYRDTPRPGAVSLFALPRAPHRLYSITKREALDVSSFQALLSRFPCADLARQCRYPYSPPAGDRTAFTTASSATGRGACIRYACSVSTAC